MNKNILVILTTVFFCKYGDPCYFYRIKVVNVRANIATATIQDYTLTVIVL